MLVALATIVVSGTYAQVGRPSLSIGAELGIPAGTLNNTQKIGIGGSAKAAFPVGPETDITVSAGYVSFSGVEIGSFKYPALNFIPLKAGVRYRFIPGGFYLEPQLGYTSISAANNGGSTGGFTYAANAGYMINSQWDLSARYEAVSLKNDVLYPQVGVRLAYSFKL